MKRFMLMLMVLSLMFTAAAFAEYPDGNDIVKRADELTNKFENLNFDSKVTIIETNGDVNVREMHVWQSGEKRLSKFVEPPRDRGMAFLAQDDINNWIYLPAFKKVRRIAAHIRNQNVMGTDLSYEDSSQTRYLDDYTGVVIGETETQWKVELTPTQDSKSNYQKLHMYINKERDTIEQIEYFNHKGENFKLEIRDNFKHYHDRYWFPHRITVTTLSDGHKTILNNEDPTYDADLPDYVFTTRNLQRTIKE